MAFGCEHDYFGSVFVLVLPLSLLRVSSLIVWTGQMAIDNSEVFTEYTYLITGPDHLLNLK